MDRFRVSWWCAALSLAASLGCSSTRTVAKSGDGGPGRADGRVSNGGTGPSSGDGGPGRADGRVSNGGTGPSSGGAPSAGGPDARPGADASADPGRGADATADASPRGCPGSGFVHPGILVDEPQLDFVKAKVASKAEPWLSAFNRVKSSRFASLTYTPGPVATIDCDANAAGCTAEHDDAIAAYTDALLYYYSGDRAYAQASIRIMNAWSALLIAWKGDQARLNTAWSSETFPRAAELLRYTFTPAAGEAALDVTAFSKMLKNAMLPAILPGEPSANGNWELSMADGVVNIGIFTDDRPVFEKGLALWRARVPSYIYESTDNGGSGTPVAAPGGRFDSAQKIQCFWLGAGFATTNCTVPSGFVYQTGMCQETCRDISHVILGFEAMISLAETARIQCVDLYGEERKRIMDGYEWNAHYDDVFLGGGTLPPFVCGGALTQSGSGYSLGWEIAYNHYVRRLGLSMPYTKAMIARVRPTLAALHMDWETLTHAAGAVM